ncbi:WD40-repeat-containing domain [Phytophthora cactorum]|nr:WD40-repeat-containing domain [Phytophthora cactorum]
MSVSSIALRVKMWLSSCALERAAASGSVLHTRPPTAHLPPSQNSSTFVTEEDRETVNEVDTRTQLCVFAGTVDGLVLYWRFDEDAVVQVNLLVFPGSDGGGHPVVGIVSGTDEWGQSTLISATKDGALARWQLPNGACAEANASLAKELAPLLGLEMLGNRRFAVVVSEESRLMVLDTWRMQLLYCMDTAQEQIRRSIAVGELRMPQHKSPRPSSSPGGRVSPSRQSITGGSPDTRRIATFLSSSGAAEQRWDAVVLSLGAEGLVKCFLWTQPRGSTSGTPFGVSEGGGSASVAWGFRWVQRSSWVISWADEAEDITCSQSTSLKDGDNMNPQTALMGSIKNSYFPLSVHVSPDSSSVLLIWKTKFAVLKRKWLCSLEIRSDSQPNFKPFGKPRPNTAVGSCPIAPSEFVRQAATTSSSKWLFSSSGGTTVYWEDGEFSEDGNVILWTNTGHVFQFTTAESSAKPAGKFFIFTKDQDQLVPRSDSKLLRVIDKAMYVTSTDRCTCCDLAVHNDNSPKKSILSLTRRRQHSGYTACMKTGSGSRMEIVHMCHRGMLGLWTMSAGRVSPTRRMPNLSNIVVPRVPLGERVRFHSLTDGFEAAATAAQGENTEDGTRLSSQHHGCLTHFILGRDDTQASSTYEVVRRAGMRRKRQRQLNDGWASSTGSGGSISSTAAAVMASNVSVLATALAPVTVRGAPGVGGESRQTDADESEQRKAELLSYRYLLDIPVIAKGFSDGMLHIGLLSQEHSSNRTGDAGLNAVTRLPCHSGRTTALAHCFWGVGVASMSPSSASNASQSSMDEASTSSGERTPRSSLTIDTSGDSGSNNGFIRDAPSNAPPSIKFFVFSGGTDGVFRVIELVLYRSDGLVQHEARILQKFRHHRGAIQQISVSPLKRGAVGDDGEHWETKYPDRLVATVGIDRKIVIYAPQYSIPPSNRPSDRCSVEWECVLELAEHGNRICNLEWHLERGLLYVECEDRMVYIWSMDTGILERTVPCALLYGGGNASGEKVANTTVGCSLVENSTLFIGNAAVQLIEFAVLRSAEQLKKNWTTVLTAVVGVTPAIDLSCQTILGIEPAHALYSCALQDFISGALTIPVPWTTPIVSTADARGAYEDSVTPAVPAFARNWQHSSALSASIALGVVSLCMSCMEYRHSRSGNGSTSPANKEEFQVLWSQMITQHSVVLPESVAQFREPALEELAAFGFDSCDRVFSKTSLGNGAVGDRDGKLFPWNCRQCWTSGGASSGAQPSGNSNTGGGGSSANTGNDSATMSFSLVVERLGSLVLLMSMIGTYFPGEISPASAREVCDVLVYLLKAPERFVASVSAELLTKGLMLFRPHLVDLSSLIVQLLLIDMREKQRSTQSDDSEQAPTGPGGSLSDFNEGGTGGSNAAMSLLVEVGAYESAFVLGLLQQEMHNHDRPPVSTRVFCSTPPVSTAEYSLSTQSGSTVPYGGLPKETQRLALGTMEAVIVIYDLRTATKWRVLDGHASAVSAVRFRSDGQVLVSYAARDGSVRWWNSGNAGLFGGMLKMHQSCLKEHKLAALKESANGGAPSSTGGASAGLKQIIQTCRFHFLTRKDNPDGNSSSNSDQPKHILRLTREDASQVQFLL